MLFNSRRFVFAVLSPASILPDQLSQGCQFNHQLNAPTRRAVVSDECPCNNAVSSTTPNTVQEERHPFVFVDLVQKNA